MLSLQNPMHGILPSCCLPLQLFRCSLQGVPHCPGQDVFILRGQSSKRQMISCMALMQWHAGPRLQNQQERNVPAQPACEAADAMLGSRTGKKWLPGAAMLLQYIHFKCVWLPNDSCNHSLEVGPWPSW